MTQLQVVQMQILFMVEVEMVLFLVVLEMILFMVDDKKNSLKKYEDNVFAPIMANSENIGSLILEITLEISEDIRINAEKWANSVYKPTPTIIEAAQALYRGHSVKEISRSDAGAINLSVTASCINAIIETSKKNSQKSICSVLS